MGQFYIPKFKNDSSFFRKAILFVYGTGDIDKLDTDYLKLDFINNAKENLEIIKYTDLDHNFMSNKYDKNGVLIAKNFYWNKVINDVINWLKN